MPPEPVPSERRIEWLDSLRALAALWVVAHHASLSAPFVAHGFLAGQLSRFLAHGTLAVTAFIALSGFSLGLGAFRRGWTLRAGYGEFLVARWLRIVPPYYAAILLTMVLTLLTRRALGEELNLEEARSLGVSFVKHLFLVQDLDGTDLIRLPGWSNGIFWTIGVEAKIYLLFPLMLAAIRRRGLLAGAASALALALVFAALPGLKLERKPGFILVFFLGILACSFVGRVPRWTAVALAAMGILIGFTCIQSDPSTHQLPRDLAFGVGFCALMASIPSLPRLKSMLKHRWLAAIGAFAYSLYLTHGVVLLLLGKALSPVRWGGTLVAAFGFIALGVAVSLLVARGFFALFERPFLRIRHRSAQRVTEGAA